MRYIRPIKDENKIYYYCSLSTAVELILPHSQLLLSPMMKTNDPRENKPPLFIYNSNVKNTLNLFELNRLSNLALKDDCKVICFSKDYKNYQGCLLSKMWAQYGGNHKGVCLEIDKKLFTEENLQIENNHVFKDIIYVEPAHMNRRTQLNINLTQFEDEGNLHYLRKNFRQKNLDQLYFTKNDEWESESEKRLLLFSDLKDNEYCSIKNSLVGIHLGVDFNIAYMPTIKQFCANRYLNQIIFLHETLVSQPVRGNFS